MVTFSPVRNFFMYVLRTHKGKEGRREGEREKERERDGERRGKKGTVSIPRERDREREKKKIIPPLFHPLIIFSFLQTVDLFLRYNC